MWETITAGREWRWEFHNRKKNGECYWEMASISPVRDTGVGIPEDRRHLLFQYEEKTSTLGTEGEKGTGFGLPLCNDIMMAHGGTL